MAALDHNIVTNDENFYDIDRWIYLEAADSYRPPNYNPNNCSCTDLGGYTSGLTQVRQPTASSTQDYQYEINATVSP